jgi:GNAT superfamily N-acetyltransferase
MLRLVVPEAVRRAALFPGTDLPPPAPEHPSSRVTRDGYSIGLFPGRSSGTVLVERFQDVESAVADIRRVLADDGKQSSTWFVPEPASPPGLAAMLLELGLTPAGPPSLEPRYAAMALVTPPAPGPDDVEARRPRSFAEYRAGRLVSYEAFGESEEDVAAMTAQQRTQWEVEQRNDTFSSFVALVDGEVCGGAASHYGANAAFLAGGYTRSDMRGRGVYRALVRARWDAAAARGLRALTVGAGAMSRPILERLGFEHVGWVDCLRDEPGG